jgi:hypothetical protein
LTERIAPSPFVKNSEEIVQDKFKDRIQSMFEGKNSRKPQYRFQSLLQKRAFA